MSIMKILWHFVMKLKPKKYPSHEASIVLRFHLWCQKYCNSTSWHFFVFLRSSRYKKSFLFSLLLLASWFYKILLQIYENFGCSSLFCSFFLEVDWQPNKSQVVELILVSQIIPFFYSAVTTSVTFASHMLSQHYTTYHLLLFTDYFRGAW